MSKGVIISLLVGATILIGGGYYLYNTRSDANISLHPSPTTPSQNGESQPTSLRSLLTMNNQVCTFSDDAGTQGSVYVANGQVRGEFVSQNNQGSTTTHMYTDSEDIYLWFDGQSQGFKTSFATVSQLESSLSAEQKVMDLDQQVDYDCQPWTVDQSQFTLPTTVQFTDYSQVNLDGSMLEGDKCSVCDSLPSAAATQCRQSLGCN